jgi:hypothetical protein
MLKANTLLMSVLAFALLSILMIVAAIYWNEGRKEIFYLCGNFGQGVLKQDVIRQLDTGHFLRYQEIKSNPVSSIVVDSQINFGVYRCHIKLDKEQKVITATFN